MSGQMAVADQMESEMALSALDEFLANASDDELMEFAYAASMAAELSEAAILWIGGLVHHELAFRRQAEPLWRKASRWWKQNGADACKIASAVVLGALVGHYVDY
jgi:hypothetical protein